MITIKDIARLAGVSVSTVSKALNNRPDIGEETRKKILEIAKTHNFTPHAFGKALKKKSSENIGVLFCRDLHSLSGNPFYSRVLEGIEAELALNNYSLLLQIITETTPDELPKMIRERLVDGLILVGTFRESYLQRLLDTHLPAVLVDPCNPTSGHSQILIDNEHGAFQATQYLIGKGHHRIGFISGDISRLSFRQRLNGYSKALKSRNLPVEDSLIRTGGLENGYEHVKFLLGTQKVTAIFSANDINAIYGYKAIHEMGLKIPEDISMIGFDDIDLAKFATPPLTTVRVYKEELGSIAVRSLLKTMQNENEKPANTIVPTRLVERESVRDLNV
ncbi:LacI family DNA-binding transcriptional regulator [bacterium]|nr:LacI family DNA-binding transcriptional regulator [bacterium]